MCEVLTEETKIIKKTSVGFSEALKDYENGDIDTGRFLYLSDLALHVSIYKDLKYQMRAYGTLISLVLKSIFRILITRLKFFLNTFF